MAEYKVIQDRKQLALDDFEGKLVEVRDYLDSLIEQYGDDARLVLEWDYENVDLELQFDRKESEAERAKRLEKARKDREKKAAAKAVKEEEEQAELARLLEKYGAA